MINFLLNYTPLFYWNQSLWRDEAFSVWIAQGSIPEIIQRTSLDFNPPLYYILLHVWMQIFGSSEVALRGFSVLAFLLLLMVIRKFAQLLFQSKKFAVITTILVGLNPMLLYFAFELRMYALLALFAALSMYFFYTQKWKWHIITTALGLYTQPYLLFLLAAQCIYLLLQRDIKRAVRQSLGVLLLYLPWIPILINQLAESGPMWMYPINSTLVLAVLGNLFLGYEGTPGHLWQTMQFISALFLGVAIWVWKYKKDRSQIVLLYCWLFIPVIAVLVISFVKPIYVHRYLIYVAIAQSLLVSYFLTTLNKRLQKPLAVGFFIILITANLYAADFHRKVPIRTTFTEINPLLTGTDVVYAASPLVFYESVYYTRVNVPVYLYNPTRQAMPRFVGNVGMPENTWAAEFPRQPQRAFVIKEDGSYTIRSEPTP